MNKKLYEELIRLKNEIEADGMIATMDEAIERVLNEVEQHDCKDEKCDNPIHQQI